MHKSIKCTCSKIKMLIYKLCDFSDIRTKVSDMIEKLYDFFSVLFQLSH